jgi:hypothetical protein
MHASRFLLISLLLGLLSVAGAQIRKEGDYWVEVREGSVPAGARLHVTSVGGIQVRGDEADAVRYRVVKRLRAETQKVAERFFSIARLAAVRQGDAARLSLEDPQCGRCNFQAELTITAPHRTGESLLQTSGGALSVEAIDGRVTAETAGGPIRMSRIGDRVRASTAGGDIDLDSIGGDVLCETAGGSITLRDAKGKATLNTSGGSIRAALVQGELRAETAGGSIEARQVNGTVLAATSGGSIALEGITGPIRAETAGGSIRISEARRGLQAETAGGNIELTNVTGPVQATNMAGAIRASFLAGMPFADSRLETSAGTITVWLPASLAVTIEAYVDLADSLRRIRSEFDAIQVLRESSGVGPGGVAARGALNGGGPLLRIHNATGRIEIRKQP